MSEAAADQSEGCLWHLLYVSSASYPFSPDHLDRLLLSAKSSNQAHGITGVLLHCGGNFMQLLEGPRGAVLETFRRVRGSAGHHSIIEILSEPAATRHFADWAMACAQTDRFEYANVSSSDSGNVVAVLRKFWELNR